MGVRELIFKAKQPDDGEWVEGYLVKIAEDDYRIVTQDNIYDAYTKRCDYDGVMTKINPETICQYTGLTDKNGNKIWENDVVYARCKGLSGRGIIKYNNGCLVLKDKARNRTYSLFGEWTLRVDGNIFDNPEALERMG